MLVHLCDEKCNKRYRIRYFPGEYRYTTMISGKIVLPELPYKSIYKHREKSSVG